MFAASKKSKPIYEQDNRMETVKNSAVALQMKEFLGVHLRSLQVISLSIVTQEENILFQIPHASVLVITHTFL